MVAVTLAAVLLVAYLLRYTILPLAVAAALAYVLRPLVEWLRRRLHVPRIVPVLLVFLTLVALFAAGCWALVVLIGDDIVNAVRHAPELISRHVERLTGPEIHLFGQTIPASETGPRIMQAVEPWLLQSQALFWTGTAIVGGPATIVLVFVALFYFINSGGRIAEGVLWLAPPRHRGHLRELGRRIDPVLHRYIRGVFLVVLYTALVAWLVLQFGFHIGLAPLWAVVIGLLEVIPVIGPALSMVLIGGGSVLAGGGIWHVVWAFVFAVGLRVSIDEVVGPLLLGRAVTLHPVVVVFAFLTGATLFGILGVLLAVPVAAATKIVLAAWYDEDAGI